MLPVSAVRTHQLQSPPPPGCSAPAAVQQLGLLVHQHQHCSGSAYASASQGNATLFKYHEQEEPSPHASVRARLPWKATTGIRAARRACVEHWLQHTTLLRDALVAELHIAAYMH